jgi:hypothetical protein
MIKADDGRFLPLQIAAFLAVIVILVFLFWSPAFNSLLARLQSRWEIQQPIQIAKREMILSLFWMFIAWIGGGFLLFTLARGFLPLDWSHLPSMVGIWGGAGAISLSLGALIQGMGLREITLAALLSSIMPMLHAIVISIAFRLALTVGEILWVAIFAWITRTPSNRREGAL